MISVRQFLGAEAPAAEWFRNHTWNKVASGVNYPQLFRRMVLLSALYEYGGTAVEFGGTVQGPAPPPSDLPWCADVDGQAVALYAPRGHAEVKAAIADFVSEFSGLAEQQQWLGACPFASSEPSGWIDFDSGPVLFSPNPRLHYGVLWHDQLVRYQLSHKDGPNLGDDVQMLAAAQWLPYIDARVERDNMRLVTPSTASDGSILLIMNAFWGYKRTGTYWPPPAFINPILVSMHISPSMYKNVTANTSAAYLKQHGGPFGARDNQTLTFLRNKLPGVPSYLSYCMTSTLESMARPGAVPQCPVLLVDVPNELLPLLPPGINRPECRLNPKVHDKRTGDGMFRVKLTFEYLTRYAEAKVIITTRLHCGVPAAGMGVPVILVKHKDGVTGRFDGFHHLFHTVDIWKRRDKAKAFLQAFDYEAPPPIPARTGPTPEWRKVRCALLEHISAHHPTLLDAIYAQSLTPAFERCEAFRQYQLSGRGLLT